MNTSLMVENVTRIKSRIKMSVGVSVKIRKNIVCIYFEKYIWNPATCSCKNGKYVGSITDDFVISCDKIIEETKFVPTKSTSAKTVVTKCNSTKTVLTKCASTKTVLKNFYILLAFSLITRALLIAVSIYFYLIKYQVKQNLYYLATTPLAD